MTSKFKNKVKKIKFQFLFLSKYKYYQVLFDNIHALLFNIIFVHH